MLIQSLSTTFLFSFDLLRMLRMKNWRVTQWTFDWTLNAVKNIPPMKEILIRIGEKTWKTPQILVEIDLWKSIPNVTKNQSMCSCPMLSCYIYKYVEYCFYSTLHCKQAYRILIILFLLLGKKRRSALAPVHPRLLHRPNMKKKVRIQINLIQKIKDLTRSNWEKGSYQDLKKEGHAEDLYVYLMLLGWWCMVWSSSCYTAHLTFTDFSVSVISLYFSPLCFSQISASTNSWKELEQRQLSSKQYR